MPLTYVDDLVRGFNGLGFKRFMMSVAKAFEVGK